MTSMDYYNTTHVPIILPGETDCAGDADFEAYFQYVSVGCSVGIIILFSILEKRTSTERCRCLGYHPALIYPVNLLDDDHGRFGYAAAFGSTTSAIWNLFTNPESYYSGAPNWSISLVIMGSVLYVGVLYYPLFACLTTPWVFLGSALGFFYSVAWLLYNIREVVMCPEGKWGEGLDYQAVAQRLPVLVCLFVLSLIYAYNFVQQIIRTVKNRNLGLLTQPRRRPLAEDYHRAYVRRLVTPAHLSQLDQYEQMANAGTKTRALVSCVHKWIYKNDTTFKYSTKVICVITVSVICAYEFGIVIILGVNQTMSYIPMFFPVPDNTTNSTDDASGLKQVRVALHVFSISVIISFVLSSILTVYSIFQILVHYRKNLKLLFKGAFSEFSFHREDRRTNFIMSNSLSYAGSQVGYILWGYIILFVVLLIKCFIIAYLIILPLMGTVSKRLLLVLVNAIPTIAIYQGLYILQHLFSGVLLQSIQKLNSKGLEVSKSVLAVNNRKIYHNASYFLFFFYIVLGVFGCLFTILKGMVLGIFHLSRLEKSGLSRGYETWDTGHMYYLSFLYLEEAHRHPVLLVFCDILYGHVHRHDTVKLKRYGATDEESSSEPTGDATGTLSSQQSLSLERRVIRNRWFKLYTLVRNPSLVRKEKNDVTSANSDGSLIAIHNSDIDTSIASALLTA